MDQLIFASLSHTHYWYEVGMLRYRVSYRGRTCTSALITMQGHQQKQRVKNKVRLRRSSGIHHNSEVIEKDTSVPISAISRKTIVQ